VSSFIRERRMMRVSVTSSSSTGMTRSSLAKTSETLHSVAGFRSFPPLKMRSESLPARIALLLLGPRTNRTASPMFDLPEPLGPVMAVKPSRKGTVSLRPKLLKFSISTRFRCMERLRGLPRADPRGT